MKKLFQTTLWFIILVSLVACGSISELKNLKNEHEKGHYETVVKTDVKCKTSDKACNQLHLIKGDACYRLGKQGKDPVKHFDCAIEHLDKGIKLTSDWKLDDLNLNQDQTYENLCESLRERQDMNKGSEADKFTRQLLETSENFEKASPDNLAAIYFNNGAKFTLLRGPILSAPGDAQVCAAVNNILSKLKAVSVRAASSKYANNFSILIADVEGIKPVLNNCQ